MAKRPITVEDLARLVFVGDPQISPDGSTVLFAKKVVDEKKKYLTQLCTVDLAGSVQQWTQGAESVGSGRWSPDGASIAFVADRDKKGSQIYMISTKGGEARKLTLLPEGGVGELKWSPDSNAIAFTFRETAEGFTKKAQKARERN
jgi:dipeptidyl aminopeptidase/acylaminoacyl peptidase